MKKGNLFSHVIKKEERIDVPLPNSTVHSTTEDKSKGFWFKPGNLLPKREKKKGFPIKNIVFISIIVFLCIFVVSLMSANSSLVETNQISQYNASLMYIQLNTCNTDKTYQETFVSTLKTQLDECNNKVLPFQQQRRCTVSDCNMYINTYNLTDNPNYIQSLKKEIYYLENLTYQCLNVNSTINYTTQGYLKDCRDELKEIRKILED